MRLLIRAGLLGVAMIAAPGALVQTSSTAAQQPRSAVDDQMLTDYVMWSLGGVYRTDGRSDWGPAIDFPPVDTPDLDTTVQDQELDSSDSILHEIDPVLVIASNRTDDGNAVPGRRGVWSFFRSPVAVVHAANQDRVPVLRMLVTSLGVSTGEAFTVQFLNQGPTPITLPRGTLTLRPLKQEAAARAVGEFKQQTGRLTTLTMSGYCLDYRKVAPRAGMVYAVAPRAVQESNMPVREVLRSAAALNAHGFLKPEGDARQYFHSIRQWALWTRAQRFTERSFTSAMLDHAKKNALETRRRWTPDDEKFMRASAAKRWRDVNEVLRLADKVAQRRAMK